MKPLSSNLINKLSPFDPTVVMALGEQPACRYLSLSSGLQTERRGVPPVFPRSRSERARRRLPNVPVDGAVQTSATLARHWLKRLLPSLPLPSWGFKGHYPDGEGSRLKRCGQNASGHLQSPCPPESFPWIRLGHGTAACVHTDAGHQRHGAHSYFCLGLIGYQQFLRRGAPASNSTLPLLLMR